ncbi:beta/alpha barrel domain-containing protein [Halopelagius longus]|uniref:Uncharacterized protein n=1 Tax=Halopelagius longus TaxID=1236180 RepID=A0A1H1C949_9EURY|nr:hypothetical protein [Halopelagius longus]SDQ60684.1 hypothetical protein SAMN05216278_2179 [Halopelagius longus]
MTQTPARETTADESGFDAVASDSATADSDPNGEVRDALRELAEGTAPRREAEYEATIADAVACLPCVRDAAAFVAEGNVDALARAVGDARAAGDEAAVERGRRALAVLRRLRSAARTDAESGDADQFRSGHGTVLPGAGQPRDR